MSLNRPYVLEKYRDKRGDFRWRLKSPNGRVRAESGEGYKRRGAMDRAIAEVSAAFPLAVTRDLT